MRSLGVAIAMLLYLAGSFIILGLAIDIMRDEELVSLANAIKAAAIVFILIGMTALKRKAGLLVP